MNACISPPALLISFSGHCQYESEGHQSIMHVGDMTLSIGMWPVHWQVATISPQNGRNVGADDVMCTCFLAVISHQHQALPIIRPLVQQSCDPNTSIPCTVQRRAQMKEKLGLDDKWGVESSSEGEQVLGATLVMLHACRSVISSFPCCWCLRSMYRILVRVVVCVRECN